MLRKHSVQYVNSNPAPISISKYNALLVDQELMSTNLLHNVKKLNRLLGYENEHLEKCSYHIKFRVDSLTKVNSLHLTRCVPFQNSLKYASKQD